MYFSFEVADNVYKLRLNTRAIVALERNIGCNPLAIFGTGDTMPTVGTMVAVLHASLQQYHHNITVNDAYDIFDEWLSEDHTVTDFIQIILEIYKVSGIIKAEDNSKN